MPLKTCARCGFSFETELQNPHCPSCGVPIEAFAEPRPHSPKGWFRQYLDRLQEVLAHPIRFFNQMSLTENITTPLVFALVTHWFGALLSYFWTQLFWGERLLKSPFWDRLMHSGGRFGGVDDEGSRAFFFSLQEHLSHWMLGIGPVLLDPFFTLFWILLSSLFIFVGARLFVAKAERISEHSESKVPGQDCPVPCRPFPAGIVGKETISFESSLRIVCYSLGASIFSALPAMGGVVSSFWVSLLILFGVREVYRVSTGRAIVVTAFPFLILFAILLMGVALFAVGVFKFFSAFA